MTKLAVFAFGALVGAVSAGLFIALSEIEPQIDDEQPEWITTWQAVDSSGTTAAPGYGAATVVMHTRFGPSN
jgi:hypothetical protein